MMYKISNIVRFTNELNRLAGECGYHMRIEAADNDQACSIFFKVGESEDEYDTAPEEELTVDYEDVVWSNCPEVLANLLFLKIVNRHKKGIGSGS